MPHHFIPSNSVKTIKWSGGTSSELFIYPEGSDFKTGNYQVRLSTNRILIDALKDALIVVVEIKNLESGELS